MRLRPALDDKQTKLTARFMIRMADSLNRVVLAALPKRHEPTVTVSCVTCHHGSPLPQTIDAALAETIERQGVDSAIARYRSLRANMAGGRYNFTETPINELAQSLAARGRTPDAVALLTMNQEFWPNSPDVDFTFGEVYRRAGDKDNAIARYRAVLTKRPNDMRAHQRLQELGAEPAPVRKEP
jgi:tetratricopeptide (TPR) repeat protein